MQRGGWIAAVTLAGLLALALTSCQWGELSSRPAPSWALVNQEGAPFGSANLRGKVALVTFVYTHCPTVCPLLTAQMKQLQEEFKRDGTFGQRVVFVSMTVDPPRDTPTRLKEYATSFGVDFSGWAWVTGEAAPLEKAWQAFNVVAYVDLASLDGGTPNAPHAGYHAPSSSNYEVIHTAKTILIDAQGNIRAEYVGPELPLKRVSPDMRALLAESP